MAIGAPGSKSRNSNTSTRWQAGDDGPGESKCAAFIPATISGRDARAGNNLKGGRRSTRPGEASAPDRVFRYFKSAGERRGCFHGGVGRRAHEEVGLSPVHHPIAFRAT